jgi:pSer/pThr/pTyr-binding forkhead associated (FHA) protein
MDVKLVVVGGKQAGTEIPVAGPKFLIGRGEECRLRPQSNLVSRKHCAILVEDGLAAIEDFGSTNGTHVNGQRIKQRRELKNGDRIKIGVLEFDVQLAVSVAGKKKPKVHNVQEAAARTVASAAAGDDLDISSWLKDDDEEDATIAPPLKKPDGQDTTTGKNMDDTMNLPAPPSQPGKTVADNSRSAANEVLKQFYSKKKL